MVIDPIKTVFDALSKEEKRSKLPKNTAAQACALIDFAREVGQTALDYTEKRGSHDDYIQAVAKTGAMALRILIDIKEQHEEVRDKFS